MRAPSRSIATAWSALALLFLALLAWAPTREALQAFDDQVWEWMASAERPALVWLADLLDVVGSTVAMAFVTALVAGALWWRGCRWQAAAWTLAMVVPQLLNILLKHLYERPRPPMPLIAESTWSFPSGHSVIAAALITAIVYVIPTEEQIRPVWLVSGSIYVAAVAFSRVYLRVHWLSDVAAGVAEGVAVATIMVLIVGLSVRRRGAGTTSER